MMLFTDQGYTGWIDPNEVNDRSGARANIRN